MIIITWSENVVPTPKGLRKRKLAVFRIKTRFLGSKTIKTAFAAEVVPDPADGALTLLPQTP